MTQAVKPNGRNYESINLPRQQDGVRKSQKPVSPSSAYGQEKYRSRQEQDSKDARFVSLKEKLSLKPLESKVTVSEKKTTATSPINLPTISSNRYSTDSFNIELV